MYMHVYKFYCLLLIKGKINKNGSFKKQNEKCKQTKVPFKRLQVT